MKVPFLGQPQPNQYTSSNAKYVSCSTRKVTGASLKSAERSATPLYGMQSILPCSLYTQGLSASIGLPHHFKCHHAGHQHLHQASKAQHNSHLIASINDPHQQCAEQGAQAQPGRSRLPEVLDSLLSGC